MNPELERLLTRRRFLKLSSTGIGTAALATLLHGDLLAQEVGAASTSIGGLSGLPHLAPKAKRVIYLFQGGAPSQHELWDYKPKLAELRGTDLPDSVRQGQRLTPNDGHASRVPHRPFRLQVCSAWQFGGVDQRADAAYRQGGR